VSHEEFTTSSKGLEQVGSGAEEVMPFAQRRFRFACLACSWHPSTSQFSNRGQQSCRRKS
ncbi:hypothetical protein ACV229_37910, partial [Burkholderia sp. MR1-5-21]